MKSTIVYIFQNAAFREIHRQDSTSGFLKDFRWLVHSCLLLDFCAIHSGRGVCKILP